MPRANFRHSEEAIETVENIVSGAEHVQSVSDFYKTLTDYALERSNKDYVSDIHNYDAKVEELGLDELSPTALDYIDFVKTVHTVVRSEEATNQEKIDYLEKISEEELMNLPENYEERY
jgi:hypothetical protein